MLARPGSDTLGEERDADAHQLAAGPLLGLFAAQFVVPGDLHGQLQCARVLTTVVFPAGLGDVRELLGPQQVFQSQFGRIDLQLGGQNVDHPLDQIDGLGDPERARIGHTARRLVGVDALDRAMRGLQVVAAGEDVEEAGREFGRLRGAVERAVVGQHVDLETEDRAVLGRGDAAGHVIVAGERGGHQVLAAVLHPLHRFSGDDRPDDGQHVSRVDADLVAETAADVRRDDLDLVLGDAGDQRVDGAVGVRRLIRGVDQQLSGHRVHRRDGAAGLHRCGMHSGIEHLLGDDDLGIGEDPLGLDGVARFPVEDVVVVLALDVVPDDGGTGLQRPLGVDDRGQRFVVDLDQLQGIPGDVLGVGDDEGDFLVLEAHLVGGQHGLHVGTRGSASRPGPGSPMSRR